MRHQSLEGKVAFISGAAGGLGAALATELAANGARIAAADVRTEALYARVARMWERGIRAEAIPLAPDDPAAVRDAVERCLTRLGGLDILINHAGTEAAAPIAGMSEQTWLRMLDTHLHTPFLLTRQAAAHMRRSGGGEIVNVVPSDCHAGTWGLLGLSHGLQAELRPHGIRVTAMVADGTPRNAAKVIQAIRQVLLTARDSRAPIPAVLPMPEGAWP